MSKIISSVSAPDLSIVNVSCGQQQQGMLHGVVEHWLQSTRP
jgi:hypothetical protein